MRLDTAHPSAGPLGEKREADLVNGSKVYNVRFYSLSIIQRWKKERGRGKGGQERAEKEGRRGGSDARRCAFRLRWMSAALQCPFAKCGRNAQCGGHVLLAESLAGRSVPQSPSMHSKHSVTHA